MDNIKIWKFILKYGITDHMNMGIIPKHKITDLQKYGKITGTNKK